MLGLGTPELLFLLILIIGGVFYFNRKKLFGSDANSINQSGPAQTFSPITTDGEEQILLESDDKSITLTTLRIIQRGGMNTEIYLKDISSYEVIKGYRMVFKIAIPLLFGCLPFTFGWDVSMKYMQIVIGGLVASFILMFYFPEKKLKIIGAYGIVEFQISNLSETALNNFIITMNGYRKKIAEN